jgi:CHASE2 domain-containing sensor protein
MTLRHTYRDLMVDCAQCIELAGGGTWKGAALLTGLVVACPCHLPITIGVVSAASGGAAVAAYAGWLVGLFGALFLGFIAATVVWLLRHRDQELALEEHQQVAGHDADA